VDKKYFASDKNGFDGISTNGNDMQAADIVENIFSKAIKLHASDIHIEPLDIKTRVRLRIDGLLRSIEDIPAARHNSVISRIKVLCGMDIAEKRVPQDGRLEITREGRCIDLRISTLPTIRGEKIVIRVLDKERTLFSLNQLAFSVENLKLYQSMYQTARGIVLITGPTGSGKSTTLYATLNELNTQEQNIITIEDPVEYKIAGINQVAVNPKTGLTFAKGLRAIVRQDPNIIMVGEIRDVETAQIAIQSALTGHLVLSTLHTNSAAGAVTRLLDMGIEPFLLVSALRGVVAQRLVRKICPHCCKQYEAEDWEKNFLHVPAERELLLQRGEGCEKCGFIGYKGRMAVQEVLPITEQITGLILHHDSEAMIQEAARQHGFISLKQDGIDKVMAGYTTVAELIRSVCN
jgi:type IV pilus assembly protein PilB